MNCPICNSQTDFLIEKKDRFGQQYHYVVCKNCRFLFEKGLAHDTTLLKAKISNLYGPHYFSHTDEGWRGRGDGFFNIMIKILAAYRFLKQKKAVSVLDYGAGNGYLASKLAQHVTVFYYDTYEKPTFSGKYTIVEKPVVADAVCAVELVEHFIDMNEWDFLKTVSPDVFVFTTCVSDNINDKELASWTYLNPDAGHMALYSTRSLRWLAKKYGFMYLFFPNITCHIFIKSKFLSSFNLVAVEYFLYSIFRNLKYLFKK